MPNPGYVHGTHHLTFCVGGAQEDYDFHVRMLGLKSVKKTVLFDGEIPIYHLYYGNRARRREHAADRVPLPPGRLDGQARHQPDEVAAAVGARRVDRLLGRPPSERRRRDHPFELFGTERLNFEHPCGIQYPIVGDPEPDSREPYSAGGVPDRARDPRRLRHHHLGARARADRRSSCARR